MSYSLNVFCAIELTINEFETELKIEKKMKKEKQTREKKQKM